MKKKPYILIVDDEKDICESIKDILEDEGYEVAVANNGEEAKALKNNRNPDLILLDIWMPDIDGISLLHEWRQENNLCPVIMMSGHGTLEHAIEATKLGASDFLEKPLTLAKLLLVVEKNLENESQQVSSKMLTSYEKTPIFEPVGRSLLIKSLKSDLNKAAANDHTNILLVGEKGSEISGIASYLHHLSQRKDHLFLELNLATIQPASFEALFLSPKLSYSSTSLIEDASNGILFLKNIDAATQELQTLLYHFISSQKFVVPRTTEIIQPNIRFIFSSHSNIPKMVTEGTFNKNLWHIINEVAITIPSLRHHPEDVPELIAYYVHYFVEEEHMTYRHFSIAAQNRLRNHHWFGDHLELKNLIKCFLILGKYEEVTLDEVNAILLKEFSPQSTNELNPLALDLPLREAREQFERTYLIAQYKKSEGNIANLADRVGMERTNLYRKLKSLDIDPKKGY